MSYPKKRKTDFFSVNLTKEARDQLRSFTIRLVTPAGRRTSMSDALIAALTVASEHPGAVLTKLLETPLPPDRPHTDTT